MHRVRIRAVRPSLLDPRFAGDPWVVPQGDGTFALCLGNYSLSLIHGMAFDLPSFNQLFGRARHHRRRQRSRGD